MINSNMTDSAELWDSMHDLYRAGESLDEIKSHPDVVEARKHLPHDWFEELFNNLNNITMTPDEL